MGRLAIGADTANYTLEVESNDLRALNITSTVVPESPEIAYGIHTEMTGAGTGPSFGSSIEMLGTGPGTRMGNYITINNNGNGTHTGSRNNVSGSGDGSKYGSYQQVYNTGAGDLYGSYNSAFGNGTGKRYGVYNIVAGKGQAHYGVANAVYGDSSSVQVGTVQVVIAAEDEDIYGTKNTLQAEGAGNCYGTYNDLNTYGSGVHYGSYNEIFNLNTSGTQIAGYFSAAGTGTNYAAIFSTGHVVANESGGSYDFRIESDDEEDMFFLDGSANRIGIGTNTPTARVELQDSISEGPVLKLINKHKGNFSDGIVIQAGPDSNPTPFNQYFLMRDGDGSVIGSISGNSTGGVQYNTTSDRRLKMHIQTYRNGLNLISKIRPTSYEMISNPGTEQLGFIAQELYEVFPAAVAGTPDTPVETPMMIDYSKLTPVLVSAIQELADRVDRQQNTIDELKAENDALKTELSERGKSLEERIVQLEAMVEKL